MAERPELGMSVDEGEVPAPTAPVVATPVATGPTQTMYRPDGSAVEVPHADVPHAIRTGVAGFANDQPVLVEGPDGEPRTVSGKTAADLFTTARGLGTRVIDRQTAEEHVVKDVYESPLGYAHAGAAGLGRGLTFGLSDQALAALSPEQRDALANSKRINPGTNLAGEGVGLLASALPTGGEGLVAKGLEGATALPRAVSALGHGAEGLALRGAEGLGLARDGLAAKTLASTAQAGVEGAVYGVGNAISDSAIQNEDLTAEKVLAGAGHGAILGAGAGAGLSLLGAGAGALGRKAVEAGTEGLGKILNHLAGGAEKLAPEEGALAEHIGEKSALKTFLADQEKVSTFRALTGTDIVQHRELRALSPEVQDLIVHQAHEELPALAGEKNFVMQREALAEAAEKNKAKWGEEIGTSLKELDELGAKPDLHAIKEDVEKTVLKELGTGQPGSAYEAEYNAVKGHLEKLARTEGTDTFEGLHKYRARIDADIYRVSPNQPGADGPVEKALRTYRTAVENQIVEQGQKAANEAGSEFAARYVTAKQNYQAANWIADSTERIAGKEASNRGIGMSENQAFITGGQIGSAAGASIAGAPGAVAGGLLGGAGLGLGANYVRRYGAQLSAHLARTAVRTDLVKAASAGIDHVIDGTIGKFLGLKSGLAGLSKAVPTPSFGAIAPKLAAYNDDRDSKDSQKRFDAHRDAVAAYLANPHPQNAEATAGLPPAIAEKVSQLGIAKAQYLVSKLPQAPTANPLQPHLPAGKVSPAEQAKWLRIQRAVDNPLTVLDDLKDGKLSREAADALKATSPLLFAEVQAQVLGRIAALPKPLSHAKALAVNALLGIPSAPSLAPARIAALQANYPPASPASDGPFGPKSNPSPSANTTKHIVEQTGTRSEALTQ